MKKSDITLIFDLDGTLFRAKPVLAQALRDFAKELNTAEPPKGEIFKEAGKKLLEISELPEYAALYKSKLLNAIRDKGSLFDGASKMLESLFREGYNMIIVSASGMDYIKTALVATGIDGYFSEIHSAENYVSKGALIKKLNFRKNAAMIGDTHKDVTAAVENGLPAIAALYGYGNKSLLGEASAAVLSPSEIPNAIMRLFACLNGQRTGHN